MRDSLKDFGVMVSDKDCKQGFHGAWEVLISDSMLRVEVCKICGKKVHYNMNGGLMDEDEWRRQHKLDMLQPTHPDGTVNQDFIKYYGDPRKFFNPTQKGKED